MAHLKWSSAGERAYIYERISGKERCMASLGKIGSREAHTKLDEWRADHGKDGAPIENKSMGVVWKEYMQALIDNGRSEETISCYQACAGKFVQTMAKLNELTPKRIELWDEVLRNQTYKVGPRGNETVKPLTKECRAHRLRAIRAFCGWLTKRKKYFKVNPYQIQTPAQRKDAGRALTGREVKLLFGCWPHELNQANLSKLFFKIAFYAGTRLKETLGYSDDRPGAVHENLDRPRCVLRLPDTKGKESRQVALSAKIVEEIPAGTGPMFFGKISARTLRKHLGIAKKRAGINGRFRLHDSRVTAATEWGYRSEDLKAMMDQFGWKDAKMALHYQKVATKRRIAIAQNMTYDD